MAPRAYWKGYLKLSLVSCPIALFPASSEREKISFHQLNKSTGHRIKYRKVDAETADEVDSADIIKGYEVGKGDYIELDPSNSFSDDECARMDDICGVYCLMAATCDRGSHICKILDITKRDSCAGLGQMQFAGLDGPLAELIPPCTDPARLDASQN